VCSLGERHLSEWLSLFRTALNREVSASLASKLTFVDGVFGWINPERRRWFSVLEVNAKLLSKYHVMNK